MTRSAGRGLTSPLDTSSGAGSSQSVAKRQRAKGLGLRPAGGVSLPGLNTVSEPRRPCAHDKEKAGTESKKKPARCALRAPHCP